MFAALLNKLAEILSPVSKVVDPTFDALTLTDGNATFCTWVTAPKTIIVQNNSEGTSAYLQFDDTSADADLNYCLKVGPGQSITITKRINQLAIFASGGAFDFGDTTKDCSIFGLI